MVPEPNDSESGRKDISERTSIEQIAEDEEYDLGLDEVDEPNDGNTRPSSRELQKGETAIEVDDRQLDGDATRSLRIIDMPWSDEDIRIWARDANVGEQLLRITFSEIKSNGKSNGAAIIDFSTWQNACKFKTHLESLVNTESVPYKISVVYQDPDYNPYRSGRRDTRRGDDYRRGDDGFRGGFRRYIRGTQPYQNQNQNMQMNPMMMMGRGMFNPMMGMMAPMPHFNPAFIKARTETDRKRPRED